MKHWSATWYQNLLSKDTRVPIYILTLDLYSKDFSIADQNFMSS